MRRCLIEGWFSVVLLWLLACVGATSPIDVLDVGGVRIRKVRAPEAPHAERSGVALMPGDFVISGGGLRAVIAGEQRKPEVRGAILELLGDGMSPYEGISLFSQALYVRGGARRISVLRMQILQRAGEPALRIDGRVQLDGEHVDVSRELSVAHVGSALSISTRIVSSTDEASVGLRTHIAWGGAEPMLPGVASLADEVPHHADWIGSEGATGSTLFSLAQGPLSVRAHYESGANRLLEYTDVLPAQRPDLGAGRVHYEKALLAAAESGIGRSVRRLGFWRGQAFPEAWVYLPYRPPGSEVRLLDARGQLLLSARPDARGRVVLPLMAAGPETSFTAIATAFGHAPSEPHGWKARERAPFELIIPMGGAIRVRAREGERAAPLSVRVRLLPLAGTAAPALGPDERTAGAGDTVVTASGDAVIRAPPGRYSVLVTRGPEWSVHEAEIAVTETFSPLVTAHLEHEVDPGSWVACDLHVHAAPSPDCDVTLEDRVLSLRAEGIGFAVATDHDHITDYTEVTRRLGWSDFASVSGVEITTPEPSLGHFNVFPHPLDPQLPGNGAPDATQVVPARLFRALHALGPDVLVQVNHPRMEGGIGYFDAMHLDATSGRASAQWSADFDAMEVWNGFDLARPARTAQVFAEWLAILKRGRRVVATGSSDSHKVRYQLAGYPRTYAHVADARALDPLAVVRAIKAGAAFVTSGPFLEADIAGVGPGGTAVAHDGRVQLDVHVRAPDWMSVDRLEVFVGDELVIDRPLTAMVTRAKRRARTPTVVRYEARALGLAAATDTFVVVRVSGSQSLERFFGRANVLPAAFINPIFVDADADGSTPWSMPRATVTPVKAPHPR